MKKIILSTVLVLLMALFLPAVHAGDMANSVVTSISLINQDPDPATAGDIIELRLGIENLGGIAANNLVVELVPEYPFELVPGGKNVQKIDTMAAYQGEKNMKILKYNMRVNKDASAGAYSLKVQYYEEGLNVIPLVKSLPVEVRSRENAEVIHIDKTNLVPGKQSSLKFSINNVGSSPLRDLSFDWENTDGIILPVGSDNTRYIKYIDIGESVDIEYQVIADSNAAAGLYKLNLHLSYSSSSDSSTTTISTIAGVYVGGETDFDVSFSESSSGQVSFSIANIGSNPANSVSIIVPEQRNWKVSGSNSMIIGNLNKGDYTVASFKLQAAGSSMLARTAQSGTAQSGTIPLSNGQIQVQRPVNGQVSDPALGQTSADILLLQIAYTDTMGERRLVEKEIKLSPQTLASSAAAVGTTSTAGTSGAQTSFNGARRTTTAQSQSLFAQYNWYIVGIVALFVVFLIYRSYKSKKLKNPHFKFVDFFKTKKHK